ncbi:DUF4430 domain-containing protein [Patescibacteria group bacterium]|nr:DUF4430 domain-containing protein [Patescibacteria group bacterium]
MKHYVKFIKRFYLPLFALSLISMIYFGVDGVGAEFSTKDNRAGKSDNLTERPLNIVAVDDNQTQNVVSPSPSKTSFTTQVPETPEIKNIPAAQTPTQKIKVVTKINAGRRAGNYATDYISGENAFELLKRITKDDIEYTDWGGNLGIFVDCIGGVCRTKGYEYFWSLYINGRLSEVGASGYITEPNDIIEWKYAEADFRY